MQLVERCTPLFIAFKPHEKLNGKSERLLLHSTLHRIQTADGLTVLGATCELHSTLHRIQTQIFLRLMQKTLRVALHSSSHSNALIIPAIPGAVLSCTPLFIAFKPRPSRTYSLLRRGLLHSTLHRIQTEGEDCAGVLRFHVALHSSSHSNYL